MIAFFYYMNPDFFHPVIIDLGHSEFKVTKSGLFTRLRYSFGKMINKPAQCFVFILIGSQFQAKNIGHVVEIDLGVENIVSVLSSRIQQFCIAVFFLQITNNFFENIIQCNHTFSATIFINHYGDMGFFTLKVFKQIVNLLCCGYKKCSSGINFPVYGGVFIACTDVR